VEVEQWERGDDRYRVAVLLQPGSCRLQGYGHFGFRFQSTGQDRSEESQPTRLRCLEEEHAAVAQNPLQETHKGTTPGTLWTIRLLEALEKFVREMRRDTAQCFLPCVPRSEEPS